MQNLISKFRNEKGFTQRQLSDKLGITYQSLQRYENNTVLPSVIIAIKIAKELDTTVESLYPTED